MTQHDPPPAPRPAGYWEVVASNVNFRRLWCANLISLLGDWFNTIALYVVVSELTGSPLALGAVFISKMLPWALASPVAGIIVDRLNRRRVMIVSDLARAVVVLGFLGVDEAGEVPFLYALTALQIVLSSVFEPARSAALPSITTPSELLTANTLMSATWSMMLALGAALGGFVTAWLGTAAVFLIDSLTYLVSAIFVLRTTIPQQTDPVEEGPVLVAAFRGILDGWRHAWSETRIGRMVLVKPTWSVGGGGLIYMLALLGQEILPQAHAVGIGFLLAARGVGTGLGPILSRTWFRDSRRWPGVLAGCIVATGVGYVLVSSMPWGYAVALLVFFAHMAGGSQWVLSTVLLQERTEDRYRGRVFATEWLLLTLADSVSVVVASLLLETGLLELRGAIRVFGLVQVVGGVVWGFLVIPREKHPAQDPAP